MSGATLLFSDIHGKAEALQKLLQLYPETSAVCLGDVVGIGDCDAVLSLLRARGVPCLLGNHEVDLIQHYQVSAGYLEWIKSWPRTMVRGEVTLAHTWLRGNVFESIDSIASATSCFESQDSRVLFVGHSHSPGWWRWSPGLRPRWTHAANEREMFFEDGFRYIVDVGSLGEPQRPDDPRYALWDEVGVRWLWLG